MAKNVVWSSNRALSPDDEAWDGTMLSSPSTTKFAWKDLTSVEPPPTGQLSPMSSGIDRLMDSSSAPTSAHSAPSSCADSWSNGYGDLEEGNAYSIDRDYRWEHGQIESINVPKMEPADDDVKLTDVTAIMPIRLNTAHGIMEGKQKRPRGRPRKNPATATVSTTKITKGRSKSGCITCRKRKKKCDEAKPRCMNCEKNAVVCEGYHEKQIWRSGKEKADEERMQQDLQPAVTIQPIFHAVETVEDMILWKHYTTHLSNVLTVEGEAKNAFKDLLLPLANQHQGLMHSILAVSSKHIDLDSPYGSKVLSDNPAATRESLQQRGDYHHEEALKRLCKDMESPASKDDPTYATAVAAQYGQVLCLLLQTRVEGNARDEHRVHLQAYQGLVQHSTPENEVFHSFITEFFQYHIFADELLWYPGSGSIRLSSENLLRHVSIATPRLIGVSDGLFGCLSQITSLRDVIRENMAASTEPAVEYTSLYRAAEIDAAIRNWTPRWPPGDSRHRVGPLYKQMMWIYLYRTIYPPSQSASPTRPSAFATGPFSLNQSLVMGIQRRSSMNSSLGSSAIPSIQSPSQINVAFQPAQSCPSSRNSSRTSSMHETDSVPIMSDISECSPRQLSPPSATRRRSGQEDGRITMAVDESLTILESFKPSDPAQTLLLVPCIIIGTACFNVLQRQRLRAIIRVVRGYTGLRNCDRVTELLEEVWSRMDHGDWIAVWDWQYTAKNLGLQFLCA
ncbi:hypothetical protein E4U54_002251 [Claviceps lovelessii]|nr:hypothetical protein E4U54_002251 [Claviceps lovelessii]